MGRYPVEGSGLDCKSSAFELGWFDPNSAHQRGFGNFLYYLIIAHLELKREIFGGRIQKGNNVCRVGKRKTPLCVVGILYELMRR